MPDALVEQLRARLDDVPELAPLELEPPLDLERRVQRVRRRSRTRGLLTGLSVAAVLLAAIAPIAVVERARAREAVAVDAPGRAAADPIFEDVVMLDARG